MQAPRQIAAVIRKYLRNELTEAEEATLQQWLDADPARKSYLNSVIEGDGLLDDLRLYHTLWGKDHGDARMVRIHQRIHQGLSQQSVPSKIYRPLKWLPYAAAVLIAVSATAYFFLDDPVVEQQIAVVNAEAIVPGGNRATLTFANGQTIDLSAEQGGIVVGDGVTYLDGTEILDDKQAVRKESLASGVSYLLSLATPKGGIYQVTLPDGTNVWLNAASTLKYPSQFDDKERVVELAGEAYFEVKPTPMSQPFKVVTPGQTVQVLGTHFNISAYPDDPETKTTLVAGKVKVSLAGSRQKSASDSRLRPADYVLRPGEQAINRGAQIQIVDVNTDQYTAWRSGRFSFNGKPFDQIMKEMGRWYNFTVRYEGDIPPDRFLGDAYRTDNLGTVLQFLETSNIRYRVEQASADSYLLIISNGKEATKP
ncbi:FecR domain-containing protein [Parapedobacter sp. ISTM3]|uniref:FecR family protein n=1 Tax=Parapedobacter sp. ISTM3 TaxID=2800130 RepID=UPI001904B4EE|nr:FecR domain-containing protein [Parapedobacter sp. ISTM3]MBK1440981.1 FecR domain-containing protein [Parapedobacter sp. ISTM3]